MSLLRDKNLPPEKRLHTKARPKETTRRPPAKRGSSLKVPKGAPKKPNFRR
jgi:hypothetical protein